MTSPADEPVAQAAASSGLADVHPHPPTPRPPPSEPWRPSNLVLRLITSFILIPPVLWVCWRGGLPFVAVIIGFSVLAVNEFYNFISAKGATPHRLLGTLAAASMPLIVYVGDAFYATSFLTAVLLTTMVLQLTKREMHEAIASVSATFFGIFYIGWLLAHAVSVRFFAQDLARRNPEAAAQLDPEIGVFLMIVTLAGALGCDVGAYFVGRRYGRRKLAPSISPNKTIEGALGGILAGGLFAMGFEFVFEQGFGWQLTDTFPYVAVFLFGIVLAAVGILGDLIESVLKRDAQMKDAGSLLPGVGGVLDRIDSALLAFPVMYYMLLAYCYVRFS